MKIAKRYYKRALFILMVTAITACAPRMSEREAEQTRAAYRGAAMQQALQNAQAQYPVQKAQAARLKVYKGFGVVVKVKSNDWVEVDGHPAAVIEKTQSATVYQSGLYNVTLYKSGRVALMKEGSFVGWLKA